MDQIDDDRMLGSVRDIREFLKRFRPELQGYIHIERGDLIGGDRTKYVIEIGDVVVKDVPIHPGFDGEIFK